MKTVWLQSADTPERRKDLEAAIRGSTVFKDALVKILKDRASLIERKGFNEEDYATAGWETLQAFRNGKLSQIIEILDLMDFDTKG